MKTKIFTLLCIALTNLYGQSLGQQNTIIDPSFGVVTHVLCNGDSTGTIDLAIVGGVTPYTIWWSHGSSLEDQVGLPAGTYSVTVTDSNGATATGSFTVFEPPQIDIDALVIDTCPNSYIYLTPYGGTSPYTFLWDNGETNQNRTIPGLSGNSFSVTVSDANSCTETGNFFLEFPTTGSAGVAHIDVDPVFPTTNNYIQLDLSGSASAGNWISSISTTIINNDIYINIDCMSSCAWMVIMVMMDYDTLVNIGNLPAGIYNIHLSGDIYSYVPSAELSFEVFPASSEFALHFDGGDDIVSIAPSPDLNLTDSFTIEMWVNPEDWGPSYLMGYGNAGYANILSKDKIRFYLHNNAYPGYNDNCLVVLFDSDSATSYMSTPDYSITTNTWQHIAFRYSSTQGAKVYINGAEQTLSFVDSIYPGGNLSDNSLDSIVLGNRADMQRPYAGCIDELRIWQTVRSQSEIISDLCTIGNTTGMIAHFPMDDGVGSPTMADSSPNGFVGNLLNSNYTSGNNDVWTEHLCPGTDQYDIALIDIVKPNSYDAEFLSTANETVEVRLKNLGSDTLNESISIALSLNGTLIAQESTTLSLGPLSSVSHTFIATIDISQTGAYPIEVELNSLLDQNLSNNSLTDTITIYQISKKAYGYDRVNGRFIAFDLYNPGRFFPLDTPGIFIVDGNTTYYDFPVAGTWFNNQWFGVSQYNDFLVSINTITGNTNILAQINYDIRGLANDYANNTLFGISALGVLLHIDPTTGATTYIDSLSVPNPENLAVDQNGFAYTLSTATDSIYKINFNQTPATITPIGPIGFDAHVVQDMEFDLNTGILYMAAFNSVSNSGELRTVDTLTGNSTLIGQFPLGAGVTGFAIPHSPPNAFDISYIKTDIYCYGYADGSIDLTVSGGVSPYSYLWSNGSTTEYLFNLDVGFYTVTVTDAANNTATESIQITQPGELITSCLISNISCNGSCNGQVVASASGGTPPYFYRLFSPAGYFTPWQTDSVFENLCPGTYFLEIMDNNTCISASSNYTLSQPSPIYLDILIGNIGCNLSYEVCVSASGGVPPYYYQWDFGYPSPCQYFYSSGTYCLTVTDASGCSVTGCVFVMAQPAISISGLVQDVSCYGGWNGSINLSINNGVPPYTYQWSNGYVYQNITNLTAGNYSVTVTDSNGCTQSETFTVTQPSEIYGIPGFSKDCQNNLVTEICLFDQYGGNTNFGGTPPYDVYWLDNTNFPFDTFLSVSSIPCINSSTSPFFFPIDLYNYTGDVEVYIYDANECFFSTNGINFGSIVITGQLDFTPGVCSPINSGSVVLTGVSGGTPPYSYLWSTGDSMVTELNNLVPGIYSVTIYDSLGCSFEPNFALLPDPNTISVSITDDDISCFGDSDGEITVTPFDSTASYFYTWSNGIGGLGSNSISNLLAGTYCLTLTDVNTSCTQSDCYTINQPAEIDILSNTTNPATAISTDGSIAVNVSGGMPPYSYMWSNGETTEDIQGLGIGTFCLTVTDNNSCLQTDCFTLIGSCPMPWTYTNSGVNHSMLIPAGVATINGSPISFGDYIGVFFDSLGTLACGGYIVWDGNNTAISAWGDEPSSPVKEGFEIGEAFNWKIWQESTCTVFDAIATYSSTMPNQGTYSANGISGIETVSTVICQTIELAGGWECFSLNVEPIAPNMADILDPIQNNVLITKDGFGQIYWPQYGVNQIGNVLTGFGYQIKTTLPDTLIVCGVPIVPELTPISLSAGWGIIGYLRTSCGEIETMLSSISNCLIIAKDCGGQVYWPQYNVNLIDTMCPGGAYFIKLSCPSTLIYPANSASPQKSTGHISTPCNCLRKNTGNNMTLGLFTPDIPPGSEITVYSRSGLLVGSSAVEGVFTTITLWGDDETTPEVDGLLPGEEFSVWVSLNLSGLKKYLTGLDGGLEWLEGEGAYQTNKIAVASLSDKIHLEEVTLYQNIPNPFTRETEFSIYLSEKTEVEFTILNLLGEVVEVLISEEIRAGKHSLKYQTNALTSGTYYYRLCTPEYVGTKKMVIIR